MLKKLSLILLCLVSCNTEKQLQRISIKKPQVLAKYCSTQFPCDGTATTTVITYLPGDTTYLPSDTVRIDCDTAKGVQEVPCPPTKVIRDTIKKETEKKVFDSARAFLYNYQKDSLVKEIIKKEVNNQVLSEKNIKLKGRLTNVAIALSLFIFTTTFLILSRLKLI